MDVRVFPARYAVLAMEGQRILPGYCFETASPIYDQPTGVLTRAYDVPVQEGSPWWVAIFETNGCAGDVPVRDASSDDVAWRCP